MNLESADEEIVKSSGVNPSLDQNPHLFHPISMRSVTVRNRIMVSPMCQYSGEDGASTEWHYVHLGARAIGGAGIVCTEVVHTEPPPAPDRARTAAPTPTCSTRERT